MQVAELPTLSVIYGVLPQDDTDKMSPFSSQFLQGLRSWERTLSHGAKEKKPKIFREMCKEAASYVRKGCEKQVVLAFVQRAGIEHGLNDLGVDIEATIAAAFIGTSEEAARTNGQLAKHRTRFPDHPAQLAFLRASDWEGEQIEPVRWTIRDRIRRGYPAILNGDGAVGKTTIALQLCVAVSRGTDWLGAVVEEPGPTVFFSGEEPAGEIHRRLAMILDHHELNFRDIPNVYVHCRPSGDVLLGTLDTSGVVRPTPLLSELITQACDLHVALIVIEAAADVFGGDEIVRGQVRQFMSLLRGLAIKTNAAVLLLQHPSQAGMSLGTGTAGSTHWNNAARSRLYFTKVKDPGDADKGLRELKVMKSNYGPEHETIRVRWQNGLFVPFGNRLDTLPTVIEASVDQTFLRCLDIATAQGRSVSHNTGRNYAPAIFEGMPEANGIKRNGFKRSMERLFSTKMIKVELVGPRSRQKTQIVRVGAA